MSNNNIIRAGNNSRKLEKFKTESYSTVERGQSAYNLEKFSGGSKSVQDMIGITDLAAVKTPQNKKNQFAPINPAAYGDLNTLTGRERFFDAILNPKDEKEEEESAPELYDIDPPIGGFAEMDLSQAPDITEEVKMPPSQKKLAETNAKLKELEDDITNLTAERDELKTQLVDLQESLEQAQVKIKELEAAIPVAKGEGMKAGYETAKTEFDQKEMKQYEVQKQDYLDILEKNWTDALAEIQKINDAIIEIDTQIPEIVIGYVRQLIGAERKFNDKIVAGVLSAAMESLKDLQQVVFTVNPDDASTIAEKFPQHGVAIDPSIPKGGVKIRTKAGDIDLNVDVWIDSLEKQINEQLTTAENNKPR